MIKRFTLKELIHSKNKLGNLVVALRENRSQNEISKITGIPQSALSRAESGKVEIKLTSLDKMADKLGYDVSIEFIKRDG